MKVLYFAYRDWAINGIQDSNLNGDIITSNADIDWSLLSEDYDIFIFIGWSWFVPNTIIRDTTCLCYHPSDLPSFRGGSPIQNQIIGGITQTKGTIFKMTDIIDAGPLLLKKTLSLEGELPEIFISLSKNVCALLNSLKTLLEEDTLVYEEQQESKASFYHRRKAEQAILTYEELSKMNNVELYNFIRCQQPPYPVSSLRLDNGTVIELSRLVSK